MAKRTELAFPGWAKLLVVVLAVTAIIAPKYLLLVALCYVIALLVLARA